MFELTEEKALLFHRALIGLLRDHPNLIPRARDTLMTSREKNPAQETVWDRWEEIDIDAVMQTEAYTVRRLKAET